MIRTALIAALLAAATIPAHAVPLLGDFECVTDHGGADTYHGTLRIEDPAQFGFLNEGAAIDAWHPLDISNPPAVVFDDAFAEQISVGATMIDAQVLDDEYAYSARIRTKKGDELAVYCLYVY